MKQVKLPIVYPIITLLGYALLFMSDWKVAVGVFIIFVTQIAGRIYAHNKDTQ